MRAWVIGHTGTVESLNSNLNLSEACATAIVKALTADYGISASRLKGYGVVPSPQWPQVTATKEATRDTHRGP